MIPWRALGSALVAIAVWAGDAYPATIWIDTDPACHLNGWHDVYDCLALHRLLRTHGIQIRGISSVGG